MKPCKLEEWFDLASGSTKPSDLSPTKGAGTPYPAYGGNGVMGYTAQVFSEDTTIIIGRVGEKCGCVRLAEGPKWITDNALFIRKWKREADLRFFAYLLDQQDLSRLRNKGGQPLISQKPIYALTPRVPPLPEQRRIAEILSTWDSAIEQTEKLVAAKQRRNRALAQQLLTGKRRFEEFVQSAEKVTRRFGAFPKDWAYLHIGDFAAELSERDEQSVFPVLSCTKYDGLVESLKYFDRQVFAEDRSAYKVVRRGCFAYATNHLEEGSIGYQDFLEAGSVSPIYTVFKTDEQVHDPFLYALLKTDLFLHIFRAATSASVDRRGSLRWNDFSLLRVSLPPLAEQQKIAAVLNTADSEIVQLKDQLAALRRQKQGLMQVLLTGKVRVRVTPSEETSE